MSDDRDDEREEDERERERRRSPGRRREDAPLAQVAFAEAFVALSDGILLTGSDGRIVSANPAAFNLLGEENNVRQVIEDLLLLSGPAELEGPPPYPNARACVPGG